MTTSTLEMHKQHPDVSSATYCFQKRVDLAASLRDKKAVYLDMKYWAELCDVVTGRNSKADAVELLACLRELVAFGKVFCPLSSTTFFEICKNLNNAVRKATASLVDELSLGVAVVDPFARKELELYQLLFALGKQRGVPEPARLPWVKASFFMGNFDPPRDHWDAETYLAIQKSFFDHMWGLSMSQVVETMGDASSPPSRCPELAESLNEQNAIHVGGLDSLKETYRIESEGMADAYSTIAVTDFDLTPLGFPELKSKREAEERKKALAAIISEALRDDQFQTVLRSAYISTCLHAKLRWNKGQKFKKNDFEDFEHAAAALGYCDFFFTERSLASVLTSKPLTLDQRFDCRVEHSVAGCLDALRELSE